MIDVLFQGQLDHRLDLLPRRRIDDLHAGVAQVGGDDAAAPIVPVEADLGDQNPGGRGNGLG
jgi:hypothetical protein